MARVVAGAWVLSLAPELPNALGAAKKKKKKKKKGVNEIGACVPPPGRVWMCLEDSWVLSVRQDCRDSSEGWEQLSLLKMAAGTLL